MEDCDMEAIILYSVIIPHRNQPELLMKCLDSIPQRCDIETVVVDDCSDNLFREDMEKMVGKYPNVKFIFNTIQRNAGFARNVGLKAAKGKWIIFADSDDFFLSMFDDVIDKYRNSNAELVYFKTTSVMLHSEKEATRHIFTNKIIDNYNEKKLKSVEDVRYYLLGPCSKMFLRNFIIGNHIEFDEVPVMNDTIFALKAAIMAQSISVSKDIIYCITASQSSISYQNNLSLIKIRLGVFLRANKLYHDNNLDAYKFSPMTLVLSARKYGYHSSIDILNSWKASYNNSFVFYSVVLKDTLSLLWGYFGRKYLKMKFYSLFRG